MAKKKSGTEKSETETKTVLQQAGDIMSSIGDHILQAKDTVADFVSNEAVVVKKAAKKIIRKVKKAAKKAPVKKAAKKTAKKINTIKKKVNKTVKKKAKKIARKTPARKKG